jgi:hypothetical protein
MVVVLTIRNKKTRKMKKKETVSAGAQCSVDYAFGRIGANTKAASCGTSRRE